MKLRKSRVGMLAAVASMCLTACGKKSDVVFWSSFGKKYSDILDGIVGEISQELGFAISHESKGSYPGILKEMVYSYGTRKYPSIAVGYPDHFAQHHGAKILVPLDDYVSDAMKADYDPDYLPENYIYDTDGTAHLYGVPFNKSTELLGYNGVFVDYCADHYHDDSLQVLPKTWDEWKAGTSDPASKAAKYFERFTYLVNGGKKLYCVQDADGHAHGFSETPTGAAGEVKALDFEGVEVANTRLMSWDSTDNAFITLLRQWDSKYTVLPEDQRPHHPKERVGKVLFANQENLPKTLEMLKYFKQFFDGGMFGTPADLKGQYSSDAFADGRVMFMICSSGGLSYNTDNWEKRFRVAPIPYKDDDHKFVISQGANLCMTKNGNPKNSFKVIEALTTGKFQTQWAIETGYFPASNTAADTEEYQSFLKSTSYENKTLVSYREGAKVNEEEYRGTAHKDDAEWKAWKRFVDDAFIGSATVRSLVAAILPNVFKNVVDSSSDSEYKREIKNVLNDPQIKNNLNIAVDSAL